MGRPSDTILAEQMSPSADDLPADFGLIDGVRDPRDNRIAELEAALRPLAEACLADMGDGRDTGEPDDGSVYAGVPDGQGITFGMIRRAMAALANSEG